MEKTKKLAVGILAHVDAGKTTLAEGILYKTGQIRKAGRVDHKDAFLDTEELEKARGITIFSKQAVLKLNETEVTLLDTPGHVDFSAEMERTLQVMDYAVLLISGFSGAFSGNRLLLIHFLLIFGNGFRRAPACAICQFVFCIPVVASAEQKNQHRRQYFCMFSASVLLFFHFHCAVLPSASHLTRKGPLCTHNYASIVSEKP